MKHFMNRYTALALVASFLGAGGAAAQSQEPGAPMPESQPVPQQQQQEQPLPEPPPMTEEPQAPAPASEAPASAPTGAPPAAPPPAAPPAAPPATQPHATQPSGERVPVAGRTPEKPLQESPEQAERRVRTPREVSGTVIATKTVRIRGYEQPNFVALIRTNKGNRRVAIDLGPRRDLEKMDIGRGETLAAVGPVVRVGDEQILVASRARIGDQVIDVDRSGQIRAMREVRSKAQPRQPAAPPAPATTPGQAAPPPMQNGEPAPAPMHNGQPAPAPMQNGQPPAPAPQAPPYTGPHWNGAGAEPAQPQGAPPPEPGAPEGTEGPVEPPFDETAPE